MQAAVEHFLDVLGSRRLDELPALLAPKATMAVIRQRDGQWTNSLQTADEWLAGSALAGQPAVFREPLTNVSVHVEDGRLAFLRADFTVVIDGKVRSHGVDYFTLVRDGEAWKILNAAYTSLPGAPQELALTASRRGRRRSRTLAYDAALPMISETVDAEGHLIDSGDLQAILTTIVEQGATYEILNFDMGRTNASPSRLSLRVDRDPRVAGAPAGDAVDVRLLRPGSAGRDRPRQRHRRRRARRFLLHHQPSDAGAHRRPMVTVERPAHGCRPSSSTAGALAAASCAT